MFVEMPCVELEDDNPCVDDDVDNPWVDDDVCSPYVSVRVSNPPVTVVVVVPEVCVFVESPWVTVVVESWLLYMSPAFAISEGSTLLKCSSQLIFFTFGVSTFALPPKMDFNDFISLMTVQLKDAPCKTKLSGWVDAIAARTPHVDRSPTIALLVSEAIAFM